MSTRKRPSDESPTEETLKRPRQLEPESVSYRQHVSRTLATLDHGQLVQLISTLIDSSPEAESLINQFIPAPTLTSVSNYLDLLERRLIEAFPFNRMGQDKSDYAFNRVRPLLTDIRSAILYYLGYFTNADNFVSMEHEFPGLSLGYLHLAANLVHRLPCWDNEANQQEFKLDLYQSIANHWKKCIADIGRRAQSQGKLYGASVLQEWYTQLAIHAADVQGNYGYRAAIDEFSKYFGWIMGNASPFGVSMTMPWPMEPVSSIL